MKPDPCPSCEEGILVTIRKRVPFTYKGKTYQIDEVEVSQCNRCEEKVVTAEEIRRMENIARQRAA